MSYTVKTTVTKPAGTKWFADSHPGLARRYRRVDRVRAIGLESNSIEQVDENTVVLTSVWASEDAYRIFLSKKGNSIADSIRNEYNEKNGINLTVEAA